MASKLIVAFVVVSLDRRVFDRAVHPFNLAVVPGMIWLGQPMFDVIGLADQVKSHLAECHAVTIARLLGELDAVVGQDCVNLVRHRFQQVLQELPGRLAIGLLDQLRHGEFAGAVNRYKQVEFAFLGSDLGDIDVEIADWLAFELLALGFVAVHVWQARDTMPLKASMQRRARQMWDRWLQGIEAII